MDEGEVVGPEDKPTIREPDPDSDLRPEFTLRLGYTLLTLQKKRVTDQHYEKGYVHGPGYIESSDREGLIVKFMLLLDSLEAKIDTRPPMEIPPKPKKS